MSKLTIRDLNKKKKKGEKISYITSYDYQTAKLAQNAGIDMILVGDSAGNNLLGYKDTRPVTMDEMIMLAKAVRKGADYTFVVGDMPLGSYQTSNEDAVYNALRFIKEAEMDAVKCEGGERIREKVRAMSDAGIAVMGHLGYTPQSTNLEGVVQGNNVEKYRQLRRDVDALTVSGAFSILLEAVPNYPAGLIAKRSKIPIYGIGSGRDVDGVLAIVNDVIGLGDFHSRFVKKYANVGEMIQQAILNYSREVRNGDFPSEEHFYPMKKEEEDLLRRE